MVHVTNRPNVHMRLRAFEFTLGHGAYLCPVPDYRYYCFFMMASAMLAGVSLYFANSML